jgi:hypothetical protein
MEAEATMVLPPLALVLAAVATAKLTRRPRALAAIERGGGGPAAAAAAGALMRRPLAVATGADDDVAATAVPLRINKLSLALAALRLVVDDLVNELYL